MTLSDLISLPTWRQTHFPAGERLKTWKAAVKMMADKQKDAPASGEWAEGAPGGEGEDLFETLRGAVPRQSLVLSPLLFPSPAACPRPLSFVTRVNILAYARDLRLGWGL